MKETEGTVPVNGIDMAYTAVGEGPTLLALPGGPGLGPAYLRPAFDPLTDAYRVVYPELRGSGRTPLGDPEMTSVTGAVADFEALSDALGLERVNVAGHSASAIQALIWAAEHPERVASLVLADPAPPFVPELAERLWAEMGRRYTPEDIEEKDQLMASEGFAKRDPEVVEAFVRNMYLPFFTTRESVQALDFGFTEITAANVLTMEERMVETLDEHRPVEALARIQAPTLVIGAELDPTPEEFGRLVADKIAGARYAFLEGAGHFSYLDRPEEFQRAVRSFLAEHAR